MNVVLFGPPGAGKGTQSQFIVETFNLTHVSTGDLFRAAIKAQSSLGVEAKTYMDKGALVPDSVTIGLIKEVMMKNSGRGLLLDGFPRNSAQAEVLGQLLSERGQKVDKAVFLAVDKKLLSERLTGRRVCTKCGATFHVNTKPTKVSGVCDNCGAAVYQRPDDQAEVIENRLDVYEKNTAPMKDYYKKNRTFESVDGVGDPNKVFQRICSVLKQLNPA